VKRGLIIGITGQDGSYLTEELLARGLEVHGTCRPSDLEDPARLWRLAPVLDRVTLHPINLANHASVSRLVADLAPSSCFHLAGTRKPVAGPAEASGLLEGAIGTTHVILQALCDSPGASLVFAASSEMYGPDAPAPQDEGTPLDPRELYGIAKAAGFQLVRHYRETKGLRASSAILFNHESPRRGPEFVTRRISQAVARIKLGLQREVRLGDLDAQRDWGHARSYARGLALMAELEEPRDFVLATGVLHSVREFLEEAFRHVGLDPRQHVILDATLPRSLRGPLSGNPLLARNVLGWQDEVAFGSLVAEMVDADLQRESQQKHG